MVEGRKWLLRKHDLNSNLYFLYYMKTVIFSVSIGQGICSSPYFGKKRTEENYFVILTARCNVHLPKVEQKTLVLKLSIDIKETSGGFETISIVCSNQTLFPSQSHSYTGKELVEYELRISDFHENLHFSVTL